MTSSMVSDNDLRDSEHSTVESLPSDYVTDPERRTLVQNIYYITIPQPSSGFLMFSDIPKPSLLRVAIILGMQRPNSRGQNHDPGKRPQTAWESEKIMFCNIGNGDDDDDDDDDDDIEDDDDDDEDDR